MVYSWDDKEAVCYRLYVEERKSLEEVIAYWEVRGFTPSKRAFQTQFKRWDFPSKQNPAHKNPALVARLQQLWEQNCTQKEMMDILQAEGFDINDRELLRLRLRLKLLLRERVSKPKKAPTTDGRIQKKAKKKVPKVIPGKGLINQLGNTILAEETSSEDESGEEEQADDGSAEQSEEARPIIPEPDTVGLSPEEVLRKQLRQQQLQAESDEKWRTRKRRRRTRGWAGLPADAPGEPPRFPSETTIDEAKAYLCLDNNMYRELRERFLDICKAEEVVKKTIAGPEKWAQIVQQLIKENAHLTEVFQQEPEVLQNYDALFRPKGQRALSLDVICMDVTKRLRTLNTRMSLADAKNILGLNPEQTRRVRSAFAEKLRTARFTNKLEAGEAQWTELKQAWVNESEHLVKALLQGENDPDYARKLRALEVLARDVTKRQQQENTAKDPNKKRQVHQGPGPGPAPPVVATHLTTLSTKERPHANMTREEPPQPCYPTAPPLPTASDLQIDPSLLLAASDASILPTPDYPPQPRYQPPQYQPASHYQHTYYPPSTNTSTSTTSSSSSFTPLPVYFRLHPHSSTPFPAKTLWLSILHSPSLSELHTLATREHPGTEVRKLEGLIAYKGGAEGREVGVQITDDGELGAYLGVVRGEKEGEAGKVVFGVLLGEGTGTGVGYV
ncbi:hypothetical protein COCCADRAFT_4980 [Bipolaris zeicola 26-R-13]|uniref:Uncharacterized protein n=1 Tax=Cochliobolus carbonum (strain 26-R-13) TaxID=930089 RepID=W6Y6J5_COCC2|nr:uncharacterized protein COCCADRAFT_4980 [Bipolaris zeicola 26-R-13]EUC33503.1 hypothetical protein COCCADRAFT_4980 [Bipolaris zeicola 26-R-13]